MAVSALLWCLGGRLAGRAGSAGSLKRGTRSLKHVASALGRVDLARMWSRRGSQTRRRCFAATATRRLAYGLMVADGVWVVIACGLDPDAGRETA